MDLCAQLPNFVNWRYHGAFAFKEHLIANDYSNCGHHHRPHSTPHQHARESQREVASTAPQPWMQMQLMSVRGQVGSIILSSSCLWIHRELLFPLTPPRVFGIPLLAPYTLYFGRTQLNTGWLCTAGFEEPHFYFIIHSCHRTRVPFISWICNYVRPPASQSQLKYDHCRYIHLLTYSLP